MGWSDIVRVLADAVRATVRRYYLGDDERFREVYDVAYTVLLHGSFHVYDDGRAAKIWYEGRHGFYEAVVNIDGTGKCSCPGSARYGRVCKHMLAAWSILALYRVTHGLAPALPDRMGIRRTSVFVADA